VLVNSLGVALPYHVRWLGVNKARGAYTNFLNHVRWLGVNKS